MKRGRYFMRGRKSRTEHDRDGSRSRREGASSSELRCEGERESAWGRESQYDNGRGGGSWTTSEPRRGRGGGGSRDRPPPGLRGKEIGLFYRNKTRERYKQEREGGVVNTAAPEFVMALRLPSAVVKRVEKILKVIFDKRRDELSLEGVFKCPKNYRQKSDPFEEESPTMTSPSGSQTGEYHHKIEGSNQALIEENDAITPTTLPSPGFIGFHIDNPTDSVVDVVMDVVEATEDDCVLMEPDTPIVHVDDDNSHTFKEQNNVPETESSDDDCYIYEPPPNVRTRLLPFYTENTSVPSEKVSYNEPVVEQLPLIIPKIDTPEYIPLGFKQSMKRFIQPKTSKETLAPKLVKVAKIDARSTMRPLKPFNNPRKSSHVQSRDLQPLQTPYSPLRPSFNCGQRWTRLENINESQHHAPNRGNVKTEETVSVADLNNAKRYKPLPLRQDGQQYKYGYYDIITGSFMEKLNESIAKGITINDKSSELDKLSGDYYNDYIAKINTTKYKEMLNFRERLPAYKKRKELLEMISSSQVTVISGETGCGKSTQIPQIILDEAIKGKRGANVKIIVTQPRRIAASSLAVRVSEERAEQLGASVGYVVRLERKDARSRGSITYCTTGVLLADLEVSQALSGVSHVVLDEVHERDVNVDLAMCMLKQLISKRKDLKLILMSATLDAESLSSYFNGCPTMHIEGLAYPVTDIYMEDVLKLTGFTLPPPQGNTSRGGYQNRRRGMEDAEKDMQYRRTVGPMLEKNRTKLGEHVYRTLLDRRIEEFNADLIVDLLKYICKGAPGAILVFVPGLADISKILVLMEKSKQFPSQRYDVHPLHSKLPSLEQKRIFLRPPQGVRKIVVATNIAETSITIDDVVYVIDSAKIKVTGFNVADNISTLSVEWVSQANLRQRRGRAGRVQPGVCYHLISSHRAEQLAPRLLPELQRSSLLEPVLTVKRLRLGRAEDALALVPDPPAAGSVQSAVHHLKRLGALDESETLTPLGWHLARLPVHPAAGKLLLFGALFGCLDRAASVAACWGFKDPFIMVIGKEKECDAAKSAFTIGEPSDHVAISEAVRQWEEAGRGRNDFAWENFLSGTTLQQLCDMKRQFADNLKSMGFLPSGDVRSHWENRNADNLSVFKAVVAAALYPQIGTVKWVGMHRPNHRIRVRTPEDGAVEIHPSSALFSPPSSRGGKRGGKRLCSSPGANWHAYWMKQKTSKLFLFDLTLVHTMPLLFFGELNVTDVENEPNDCYINLSSIKVRCNKTTAQLLVQLRNLLDEVLASKVATPGAVIQHGDFEENILNAVIELITAEDEQTSYFEDEDDASDQSDSVVDLCD